MARRPLMDLVTETMQALARLEGEPQGSLDDTLLAKAADFFDGLMDIDQSPELLTVLEQLYRTSARGLENEHATKIQSQVSAFSLGLLKSLIRFGPPGVTSDANEADPRQPTPMADSAAAEASRVSDLLGVMRDGAQSSAWQDDSYREAWLKTAADLDGILLPAKKHYKEALLEGWDWGKKLTDCLSSEASIFVRKKAVALVKSIGPYCGDDLPLLLDKYLRFHPKVNLGSLYEICAHYHLQQQPYSMRYLMSPEEWLARAEAEGTDSAAWKLIDEDFLLAELEGGAAPCLKDSTCRMGTLKALLAKGSFDQAEKLLFFILQLDSPLSIKQLDLLSQAVHKIGSEHQLSAEAFSTLSSRFYRIASSSKRESKKAAECLGRILAISKASSQTSRLIEDSIQSGTFLLSPDLARLCLSRMAPTSADPAKAQILALLSKDSDWGQRDTAFQLLCPELNLFSADYDLIRSRIDSETEDYAQAAGLEALDRLGHGDRNLCRAILRESLNGNAPLAALKGLIAEGINAEDDDVLLRIANSEEMELKKLLLDIPPDSRSPKLAESISGLKEELEASELSEEDTTRRVFEDLLLALGCEEKPELDCY